MTGAKACIKREKLEIFIKNSDFFNQQLFEEHPEGYYALDVDGKFIKVNKACEALTGYSRKELYNLFYKDLLSKKCIEDVTASYEKSLRGDIQHYQCTIKTKNNLRLVLDVTNAPIIVDDEIIGIYGIAKNITKFSEQKERQKESEQLHRNLVEHFPDGIAIIRNGKVVYVNPEASLLLGGIKKDDVIGKHILQFIPKKYTESFIQALSEAVQGTTSVFKETKVSAKNGSEIDVEVKAIPTEFEGSPAVILMIRDITERKLSQELMINSEKLSVAGQLAAGIAHEIRNPITAIKGFLQLMEGSNQYRKEFFSVISSEINRIELILSELLALAKPPLGHYQQKNVCSILHHVVALTRSQAILHNINISTNIKEKQINVLCDENKLKQVFINIIKNAIEAMPNGGNIKTSAELDGKGSVVIKIADQGPGIPEEIIKQIGKPFFTTKENGTGLGIMVSSEIIKHHNGEIKIDSSPQGTVMSVSLPILKA